MNEILEQVINRNDTWRGRHFQNQGISANSNCSSSSSLSSGHATLDAQLQQGGWPLDSTNELLSDGCALGAMGLFLSLIHI